MPAGRVVEPFAFFDDRCLQPFRNAICLLNGREHAGYINNNREGLIRQVRAVG
jgi:hypothetical protein